MLFSRERFSGAEEIIVGLTSEERLQLIERQTDLPLTILAIALVPLLGIPMVYDLPERVHDTFTALDWMIWAAFAADFGVKLVVAPQRMLYVRRHWIEAAMVILPFLRPLRLARLIRLARIATVIGFNAEMVGDIARERGTKFVALVLLTAIVVGGTVTYLSERGVEGSNITTVEDGIWWALVTMTTVGYGDHYPTTGMGRGVAAVLMIFGIAALSVLTASVAALLVRGQERADEITLADVMRQLHDIHSELAALNKRD